MNHSMNPVQVVAVTGGKGGVGKTNVSVNLGVALCKLGRRVTLLDADLGLANVDVLLGLKPRRNLSDVLAGMRRWRKWSCPDRAACASFLPRPARRRWCSSVRASTPD